LLVERPSLHELSTNRRAASQLQSPWSVVVQFAKSFTTKATKVHEGNI
jgi:hypothetical protein